MLNELPYNLRVKKQNNILVGIWIGVKKSEPNLFLNCFRESMKKLYKGIDVYIVNLKSYIKVRGLIICGTCDLQAKGLFMNMKLYNGYYGCQKCKIRGEIINIVQTYPYQAHLEQRQRQSYMLNKLQWSMQTNLV